VHLIDLDDTTIHRNYSSISEAWSMSAGPDSDRVLRCRKDFAMCQTRKSPRGATFKSKLAERPVSFA
jgi:hypothetical protein